MANIYELQSKELVSLLNSSSLGKVATIDIINEAKRKNEIPFVNNKKINFIQFLLSMMDKRHNKLVRNTITKDQDYEKAKEYARERNAERSASGRDIGSIPAIANPKRKESCRYNLQLFYETYFKAQLFPYSFSKAHIVAIKLLQKTILEGGLHAMAMPRGSGKTTMCEIATLWATVYHHRQYVVFIGSTRQDGLESLKSIKTQIETNEMFAEDFPEICYPIKALEGINIRTNGQMCMGERTHISWGDEEMVYPTIKGYETSGVILQATGMDARIRGRKFVTRDGKSIRPDLFITDDFQTDESAKNPDQCKKRLATINKAIIGLAGAGKAIAGFIPCTVIQLGDAADQLLDRKKHPHFQGIKTKMVITFPENLEIWKQYNQIKVDSLIEGKGSAAANAFYLANRKEMDKGCEVYWEDRYDRPSTDIKGNKIEGESSAIQNAMNLYFKDEESFYSEYQNEPKSLIDALQIIKPDKLMEKINRVPRRVVPVGCTKIVSFVDSHKDILYFVTMAFEENFTGHVIDYGTFPDQKMDYHYQKKVRFKLSNEFQGMGEEGCLRSGLEYLTEYLAPYEYPCQSGSTLKHASIMYDANWGLYTDLVYEFCRQSKYSNILIPSHGQFVGSNSTPFSEYKKKKGERIGLNWRIPATKGKRAISYMLIDTNYWKTFVHARFNTATADNGYFALFGNESSKHKMIADQLCISEYVKVEEEKKRKGRFVNEWHVMPNYNDNHLFDCVVGCYVLASYNGISLGKVAFQQVKKERKSFVLSELQPKKDQRPTSFSKINNQNVQKTVEKPQNPDKNEKKTLLLSEILRNKQNKR